MGVGYYGLSVTLFGLVSGVVLFNRSKRLKTRAEELQDEVEGGRQLADDLSAEADRQLAAYRRFHEQSVSQLQEQDHLLNIAEADKARGEKAEMENRDLKIKLKRAKKEVSKLRMQLDRLAKISEPSSSISASTISGVPIH